MFSAVRRRLCYANVAATLALVFAMSGGALAAGHYLLTSTGQISPKVLKALKGKSGPAGAQGTQGAKGDAGTPGAQGAKGETSAAGAQGAKGETGPTGATGATGTAGAKGPVGPAGSPWTAGGTLPNGATETGVWSVSRPPESFDEVAPLASFTVPLAEPPTFKLIGAGEGEGEPKENAQARKENEERKAKDEPELPLPIPTDCKGNWEKPSAAPGNLCVFEKTVPENVEEVIPVVTTAGALVSFVPNAEMAVRGTGSWAVTGK
jgi:hypothetical protein